MGNLPRRVSTASSEDEPGSRPEMASATPLKQETIGNAKVNHQFKANLLQALVGLQDTCKRSVVSSKDEICVINPNALRKKPEKRQKSYPLLRKLNSGLCLMCAKRGNHSAVMFDGFWNSRQTETSGSTNRIVCWSISDVPRNSVRRGGSTNLVEDRGQKTGIWGR